MKRFKLFVFVKFSSVTRQQMLGKSKISNLKQLCLYRFNSVLKLSIQALVRSMEYLSAYSSSSTKVAIEVATALYKAGTPLLIYNAEKLLRILLEEDCVRLVPDSYHNYMGYQEEGTVYELPWEYECSDDGGSTLTREQYQEAVSFVEWQSEKRVRVSV